ncbi:hypothetical protein FDECE_14331 [Fusarium decemcellulare]|nr:hypothetical protein FDECE_14331 [Fusarium decemcellulare]
MSGIEIFGLIAGILSTAEIISRAYGGIKSLQGLPKAFHVVGKRIPLMESTLRQAKDHVQDAMDLEDGDPDALKTLLDDCYESTEKLKTIFLKILQSKDKGFLQAYRALVANMGKKGLVESLMSEILRDVATLASYRVFQTATQHQVEELKVAIEEMNQVDPSLPDSAFEEKSTSNTHFGQGHINNLYDGSTQTNVAGNSYTAQGNMSFGEQNMDEACLTALRLTDPRDDKKRIEETKGGLLPDSYNWILENDEFKAWREETFPLLWINGDPGKGKTMSLCGIINEISPETKLDNQSSDKLLSYFFCEASDSRINTAASVLQGIIYLLANQSSSVVSCVQKRYQHAGKTLFEDRNAWAALRGIFVDVLKALRSQTVYLIIDALDECRENREKLLQLIIEELSWPHVKWIVSSRNWSDIKEILDNVPQKRRLSLELNELAVSDAVNLYIQHKVKALARTKNYDSQLTKAVHDHLSSNSQSTFLWVSLACQMLQSLRKWETKGELETFPPGLEPLYERMLEQVRTARKDRSNIYHKVICVILTVFRPISLDELGPLAEVPPAASDDESLTEIIELCGSFLTIRQRTVYFVHDSAKGFLMNSTNNFRYDAEEQHHLVFSTSLNIMSTSLRRDILGQESSTARPLEKTLDSLRYPCTRWVFHLTRCGSDVLAKELSEETPLDDFLRKHYLHWLEALGHLQSVSAGILSMLELECILQNHTSKLADLARDENRFIRYHRRGIEQSQLQVYPALVFSPTCSLTRQIYRQEEPEWIASKPKVEDYWSRGLHSMEGHTAFISAISFSHDGCLLVSASYDETVRIWNVTTGESIHTLTGHTDFVNSVVFLGTSYQIASGSDDGTSKIWDGEQGRYIRTLRDLVNPQKDVLSVAFSQDPHLLAAGSSDGQIKLWNPEVGSCMRTLQHTAPVERAQIEDDLIMAVAISQHSDFLASSNGYTACIWNLKSGTRLHEIACRAEFQLSRVTFSSKNKLAVVGDEGINILDPATGDYITLEDMAPSSSYGVAFSLDGSLMATTCHEYPLMIFDTTTWDCVQELEEASDWVSFSSDSNILASTIYDRIKIWDLAIWSRTTRSKEFIPQSTFDTHFVSASPDGSFVASFPENTGIMLWDTATKECTRKIEIERMMPIFSPNGRLLASVGKGELLVQCTKTGAEPVVFRTWREHGYFSFVRTVIFSPNNRWIAMVFKGSDDIHIRDLESWMMIKELEGDSGDMRSFVFSHDGSYLAAAYDDHVRLWDTTFWQFRQGFSTPVHPDGLMGPRRNHAVVFSKDDCWIALSCHINNLTEILIWEIKEEICILTFEIQGKCELQSFDSADLRIETTIGTFDLNHEELPLEGYGIAEDRQWVLRGTDRVLWLPPEFRPHGDESGRCYVVFSRYKIAIGLESGRVLFLEFTPDGPQETWQQTPLSTETLASCPGPLLVDRTLVPVKRRHSQARD